MVPPGHHIPKSPNQHGMLGPSGLQQAAQHHQPTAQHGALGSHQSNLMSTSMNSAQLQNHILTSQQQQQQPASAGQGAGVVIPPQQQQQPPQVPPAPHGMSNSMHGQIGLPPPPSVIGGAFDSNGVSWVGAGGVPTSSLSPTAAAAAQRRAEVNAKLNAMP